MAQKREPLELIKSETGSISRRSLMQGAVAVAGAAVATGLGLPNTTAAASPDGKAGKTSGQIVSSSNYKNIVETDSGKISGYDSGGIIGFKGVPYGLIRNSAQEDLRMPENPRRVRKRRWPHCNPSPAGK